MALLVRFALVLHVDGIFINKRNTAVVSCIVQENSLNEVVKKKNVM